MIFLRPFIEKLVRLAGTVGMVFILPLMLVTTGDVIGRGFFNKPVAGTFELSECMLAIIVLLCAAYTQQVKGHVAINFLTAKFSLKTQRTCRVFVLLLSLFTVVILTWQGFQLGVHETGVTDQLRIPRAPFKILVGIGGLLLCFQIFFDLIDALAWPKGRQS